MEGGTWGRSIGGRELSLGVVYKGETVMPGGIQGVRTIQTQLYHAFIPMHMQQQTGISSGSQGRGIQSWKGLYGR